LGELKKGGSELCQECGRKNSSFLFIGIDYTLLL
jgi:hypothetical protein